MISRLYFITTKVCIPTFLRVLVLVFERQRLFCVSIYGSSVQSTIHTKMRSQLKLLSQNIRETE